MKKKNNADKLRPLDKFMIFIIVLLGIFVPVSVVFSQATLSKSNIEVEKMKSKVEKQTNTNQSLSMQVDELASLSNIQDIAKEYGLSYNNDNIIVIK
jgi:cell division protein FtsL